MLWIASEPVLQDRFPPCIRNMIQRAKGEKGRYRTAAILAAFLGQVGWDEAGAKRLWSSVCAVEERIFVEWFAQMHCPRCETLRRQSSGYPDLGVFDLGYCQPDEMCREFDGPVEYACRIRSEDDRSRGSQRQIKTLNLARILDWAAGREGEIELSEAERAELEALMRELAEGEDKALVYTRVKVRGRSRPRFFLREREGPRRRMLSDLL
jgi:hypothetical protein